MNIFAAISITIVIAALIAFVLQKLRQPIIIGHIVTGLIVGPLFFHNIQFQDVVNSLSNFGIALLLFIIGLNLTPKVIKEVGKASFLVGLGQIIVTSVVGFFISLLLGFSVVVSAYLGLALTFSSTIIIMKLLSDKRELSKFYSKISIGLLLFQDILVSVVIIGISAFSGGEFSWRSVLITVLKGVFAFDLVAIFSFFIIPKLSSSFAKSQEFLFLFAIAWGLGLATIFHFLGFSMEIGALVAGVSLSTSPYHYEISTRLRPLRDFFIILFFILLGSRLTIPDIKIVWLPAVILSAFVMLVKPFLVVILTGLLGYKKKINFMTAVNFTQVSEFSLILIIFAEKIGAVPGVVISLITLVSLITIAGSSYFVLFSQKIYGLVEKFVFEVNKVKKESNKSEYYDVILFGCNRVGFDFVDTFKDLQQKFLVVDYDPETISHLQKLKVNCRYGDAEDNEFLDELGLSEIKMAISTIPDFEINKLIIEKVRSGNKKAVIIVISHEVENAIGLYEAGATYVITPHFLGGKYASMLISRFGFDIDKFMSEKEKHLKDLRKRKELETLTNAPVFYR